MRTSEELAPLTTRVAGASDFGRVSAFYLETGYTQPIDQTETLLIAERAGEICAALRLRSEHHVLVLRGMRVRPDLRRQGVGTTLLFAAVKVIGERECYCIPHAYLKSFYEQVAFQEVDPTWAPDFLHERLGTYHALGLDVILMRRAGERNQQ